jgi:hypothetical protein
VTPTFALQGSWLFADSDLVDLTPGIDAVAACNPQPGHQLPSGGTTGATVGCLGDPADYANTRVFKSFRRFNTRVTAGAELRYRHFLTRASLTYDVAAPRIDVANDTHPSMSRQISINVGAGVTF